MELHVITADGVDRRPIHELTALLARDDALVWLDIADCDAAAAEILTEAFHLHPKAVQDLLSRNRVPKMHAYDDHVLVVLHTPEQGERGHVHYVELNQVIGRNYLVTVHGPLNAAVDPAVALRETRAVYRRLQDGRLHPRIGFDLSYAIVSALARTHEEYVEAVTADVWRLEQRVTGGPVDDPEELSADLFRARHGLQAVGTMAALSAELYDRVGDLPAISAEGRPLVARLAEKFRHVHVAADGEREYLQGVIEFYQTTLTMTATRVMQDQNERIQRLTEATYAQSERVKKISGWAAVFFAPTLIGTVYGMNFDHMPELHWTIGYPLALVAMVLASVVLYLVFKRQRWL